MNNYIYYIIQIEIKNGNGKIKKFRKNCEETKCIFEAEYKNGKKNDFVYDYGFEGFEWQYINGKRNGKGKEFSDDNIKFEGEYLNGKRWKGKGEEIDDFAEFSSYTIFKGEYLYGQKWNGIGEDGKVYYKNGFKYNSKPIYRKKRKYKKYFKK